MEKPHNLSRNSCPRQLPAYRQNGKLWCVGPGYKLKKKNIDGFYTFVRTKRVPGEKFEDMELFAETKAELLAKAAKQGETVNVPPPPPAQATAHFGEIGFGPNKGMKYTPRDPKNPLGPDAWEDYMVNKLGKEKPTELDADGNYRWHGHHIVMREGLTGAEADVMESQRILWKNGIDPIYGEENLTWAPNDGHPNSYAEYVNKRLTKVDSALDSAGETNLAVRKKAIADELQAIGKEWLRPKAERPWELAKPK